MNTRTILSAVVLIASAASVLPLTACSSGPQIGSPEDIARRRAEAARLAAKGHEAQVAGRIDDAIKLYDESLGAYAELPGVRTNLGVALLAKKDLQSASDIFKDEVQRFPATSQQALTNLGVIHLEQGWAEQARDYFTRALDLAPNEPTALRGAIVSMMLTGGDEKQTLEYIRRAQLVERDPRVLEDYRWRHIRLQEALNNKPKYENADQPSRGKYQRKPLKKPATDPATDDAATPVQPELQPKK